MRICMIDIVIESMAEVNALNRLKKKLLSDE